MIVNEEYLKWSHCMDLRVKQAEQEEIESEKSQNSKNSDFVLQGRDLSFHNSIEDEAFKELEKWSVKTINLDDYPDEVEIKIISQEDAEKHPMYVHFKEDWK